MGRFPFCFEFIAGNRTGKGSGKRPLGPELGVEGKFSRGGAHEPMGSWKSRLAGRRSIPGVPTKNKNSSAGRSYSCFWSHKKSTSPDAHLGFSYSNPSAEKSPHPMAGFNLAFNSFLDLLFFLFGFVGEGCKLGIA